MVRSVTDICERRNRWQNGLIVQKARPMSGKSPIEHDQPLEDRLSEEARRLRARAKTLPPGARREEMLRKAEQAEVGVHMSRFLRTPVNRKAR